MGVSVGRLLGTKATPNHIKKALDRLADFKNSKN
jgi:hypothetical protein